MSDAYTPRHGQRFDPINSTVAGPSAYAIGVFGDVYAPALCHGQKAVFDPDAAAPQCGDIVAVWIHGESQPRVVRMRFALPSRPWSETGELMPTLVVDTGVGVRMMPLHKVKAVHRMVEAVD